MLLNEVDLGVPVSDDLTTVCSSNEDGFARILRLYARPGAVIVDPNYGNGVFWKSVDSSEFQAHRTDLLRDGVDMRSMPYPDGFADLVVNDPPYRYTPEKNRRQEESAGHGQVDGLYGLQAANLKNTAAVLDLYFAGAREAHRVLKTGGFLVVKCQDTVQDGKNVWVRDQIKDYAESIGFACRDQLIVAPKSVLKTRWEHQRHFRKAHSYFLVFRKGGHFPFGCPAVGRR